MAKFDLKKAILENKATFFGSLTEGQFSWFTQDTDQQIGSEPENTLPFVYMHDNKGNKWLEKDYEGYGVFGGKDYYELLDQMNGGDGDRSRGIDLAFDDAAVAAGKVLFPALTVSATLPSYHSFNEAPKDDPNQSWYTPEEDEYEDDYDSYFGDMDREEDYEDEELDESKIEEAMDVAKDMTTQEAAGHAERFAKYMSDKEGGNFTVTAGSVEGPSFDLDLDGEEYDGGSYVILTNGDIVNMALPENPVYANISMLNEAEKPKTKMKKSELKELIKSSIMNEVYLDVDNMEDAPESEVDFLAEVDAILAEADEEVAVDDTEVAVDGEENIDVDTTTEVDPNVKAVQDALTQAQAAAQKLGDKKLTDQIGNTITFFTRAHVVDKGAVAEVNEAEGNVMVDSITLTSYIDELISLADDMEYTPDIIKGLQDLKAGLPKGKMSVENALDVIKQTIDITEDDIDAIEALGQATDYDDAIIAQARKIYGLDENKKKYYKDAEADDAEHIKALEKDMEDDKESSMKIKEVVFPMWQRINNK